MKLHTLDIIGSCVNRDCFNSNFVLNHSLYFDIKTYLPRIAIVALMSPEIAFDDSILRTEGTRWYYECYYKSYAKKYFSTLVNNQADYILLDFYTDAYLGIVEYDNSYIGYLYNMHKTQAIDKERMARRFNYESDPEEYLALWKKAFDKFMTFLKQYLPDTKLIVNEIKGSNKVVNRESLHLPDMDLNAINRLWSEMDAYAKSFDGVLSINFDKEYRLDPNYLFGGLGKEFVHFEESYYNDFFGKLIPVVENNVIEKKHDPFENVYNMVRNGDFTNGLSGWNYSNTPFKIEKREGVYYLTCSKAQSDDKYKWCWSELIEINGDGFDYYKLSFDFLIENIKNELGDETVIFGIREYNYALDLKYNETAYSHAISVSKKEISIGRKIVFFQPKTRYIRVGINFKDAVKLSVSNIVLRKEKGKNIITKTVDELMCNELMTR